MNELTNTITSVGNYNNIPTSITSNTSVVNLIDGLSIVKSADKVNWSDGLLTYTVTLSNQTENVYENPTVTDVIDTNLVEFVDGTVMIDGVLAGSDKYSYDNDSHTLKIMLSSVTANNTAVIKFSVKKKIN